MAAGRGHLQRPLRVLLASDVSEIDTASRHSGLAILPTAVSLPAALNRLQGRLTPEVSGQLGETLHWHNFDVLDEGSLLRVRRRDEHRLQTLVPGYDNHWQNAVRMPQGAVQRKLAEQQSRVGYRGDLAGAQQDRDGDGQVIGRPRLPQVRRRQADGDPPHGKLVAGVPYRRPHPLPRLLHRRIGKADDVKRGQTRRDVYLDLDDQTVEAHDSACLGLGVHGTGLNRRIRQTILRAERRRRQS